MRFASGDSFFCFVAAKVNFTMFAAVSRCDYIVQTEEEKVLCRHRGEAQRRTLILFWGKRFENLWRWLLKRSNLISIDDAEDVSCCDCIKQRKEWHFSSAHTQRCNCKRPKMNRYRLITMRREIVELCPLRPSPPPFCFPPCLR